MDPRPSHQMSDCALGEICRLCNRWERVSERGLGLYTAGRHQSNELFVMRRAETQGLDIKT